MVEIQAQCPIKEICMVFAENDFAKWSGDQIIDYCQLMFPRTRQRNIEIAMCKIDNPNSCLYLTGLYNLQGLVKVMKYIKDSIPNEYCS